MNRLQELVVLAPFLEIDRCSAVGVDPPDDGEEVQLVGEVAVRSQESAEIDGVDCAAVVLIN